jgi:hypothetical protein
MRRGYPNPSETGMRYDFSSPLDMGRVTGKYMRVRYGDGEGKTCPHSAPLPCLVPVIYYSDNENLSMMYHNSKKKKKTCYPSK